MEVDLDLSQDRLRDFLQSKLQEITLQNQHLKSTRLEYEEKLAAKTSQDSSVSIEQVWNGVCNGKFVVCYQLSHLGHFEQLNVALNCLHSNYTVKYCNQGENVLVTLTFDVSELIGHVSFHLEGFVTVQLSGNTVKTLQLPPLTLQPATTPKLVNNELALKASSVETNLVLVLPEGWTSSIANTLIHCGLTSTQSNKHYRYTDDTVVVNTSTDNTEVVLKVYTKSQEKLLLFVHHILSSVPGCLVIPQAFYRKEEKVKCLKQFAEALSLELKSGLQYCQTVLHPGGDLRLKLCQLECDSDLAYFKTQKF